jgi:hypothetical protein
MLHWLVVGPMGPVDSARGPKVSRPIPRDAVEKALDELGREVEPYVVRRADGCVICRWSAAPLRLWEKVKEFARLLAEREGGLVFDERFELAPMPSAPPLPPEGGARKRA